MSTKSETVSYQLQFKSIYTITQDDVNLTFYFIDNSRHRDIYDHQTK